MRLIETRNNGLGGKVYEFALTKSKTNKLNRKGRK